MEIFERSILSGQRGADKMAGYSTSVNLQEGALLASKCSLLSYLIKGSNNQEPGY